MFEISGRFESSITSASRVALQSFKVISMPWENFVRSLLVDSLIPSEKIFSESAVTPATLKTTAQIIADKSFTTIGMSLLLLVSNLSNSLIAISKSFGVVLFVI